MNSNTKNESIFTRLPMVVLCAFISCALWGSATPSIKTGYRLLSIASSDTPTILLFAGMRFTIAGLMVLLAGSCMRRRILIPRKGYARNILILSMFQTVLQYLFFYIGVAHASGVKSAIMTSTNVFFSLLLSALLFRYEKLSIGKLLGCLIGFSGVVLINVSGQSVDMSMSFLGEGFVVFSSICYGFSSGFIKQYSEGEDPMTLSGWQFLVGGLILMAVGFLSGGRVSGWTAAAILDLLYLGFISAMAYTLWSMLLKYNPISKVSVFGFLNPLCGVLFSALFLHEEDQAFTLIGLISLLLVCAGIIVVNRVKSK